MATIITTSLGVSTTATSTMQQQQQQQLASLDSMAGRRIPLASVPSAVNSPFRHGTTTAKRTRAQAGDVKEYTQEQPPAKKQLLEYRHDDEENIDPRRRHVVDDEQCFMKRPAHAQPTALERKLAASREKKQPSTTVQRVGPDNLESIRQWQKHYRRQFPGFVFYFDGVPDDVRSKLVRQIQSLGAHEEKFFSSLVTHVVTTNKQIPPAISSVNNTASIEDKSQSIQVIAPSALSNDQRKITSMFDNTLQRRVHDSDTRRIATSTTTILTRARELEIKIWALEKIQRILKVMFEPVAGEQSMFAVETRQSAIPVLDKPQIKPANKDADLEQLLRNEKINGPADRDRTVAVQDMCSFKGCYIYIHDMDEKTKPVMVRDYPKPTNRDGGKWPRFRLSSIGRCPFVEDPTQANAMAELVAKRALREGQQEQQRQQQQQSRDQQQEQQQQRHSRATTAEQEAPQPLAQLQPNLRRSPRKLTRDVNNDLAKPLDPPKLAPPKRAASAEEMPALFGSAQLNVRGLPRMIGGVPIASGIQHSNVTSAIRSQAISSAAISSTAPGMGRRIPDSKEVSVLKRKVLERNTSITSQPPSSYMNDMRAAINEESVGPPARAAKRKAQENILGVVHEDGEVEHKHKKRATKKTKLQKDPKAGYCENCRDKFDDFDEHITSRKHQKFARTAENWKDLDNLLRKLKRPHKDY